VARGGDAGRGAGPPLEARGESRRPKLPHRPRKRPRPGPGPNLKPTPKPAPGNPSPGPSPSPSPNSRPSASPEAQGQAKVAGGGGGGGGAGGAGGMMTGGGGAKGSGGVRGQRATPAPRSERGQRDGQKVYRSLCVCVQVLVWYWPRDAARGGFRHIIRTFRYVLDRSNLLIDHHPLSPIPMPRPALG